MGVRGSRERERETLRCMVNGENLFFDSLPFALFSLSLVSCSSFVSSFFFSLSVSGRLILPAPRALGDRGLSNKGET